MPHSSAHAPPRLLVVATHNSGKLAEFRSLLAGLPFDIHGMRELGLPSPQETGDTFMANALLKARHAAAAFADSPAASAAMHTAGAAVQTAGAKCVSVAALADDSGLEVDALGGAPGIFSARYAGDNAGDDANNAKLVAALAGRPTAQRRARYRCALALVSAADDPRPILAEGVWEGFILEAPRGAAGFGYDPYFWLPELGLTAAQLEPEHKNRLSHRGLAMRALRQQVLERGFAT